MKIVHVVTRSDLVGGAHVHVRDLSVALKGQGHDVRVLAGGEGAFFEDLERHGIEYEQVPNLIRSINPFKDASALLHIRRRLRQLRPDVVSTHSSKAGWLGRLAARSLGIPVTFTAHGWAFTEGVSKAPSYIYELAERLAAPLASQIITVSEYDKRLAVDRRVAPRQKMVTIHYGTPEIPTTMFATPKIQPPNIIMVARFEKQKNHTALLRALAGLLDFPWSLELAGDGPLRPQAEDLAKELKIADRTRFLGNRTDIDRVLSKSQIFVLISEWEGLPISILEGMRAGLPVIASEVAGVPEEVIDGETGFVVRRGDENALISRLRTLILSPDMRAQMGSNGRRRYEECFAFERMVAKTLDVYTNVIGRLPDPQGDHGQ